jgi:hypothetical protein
MPAPWTAASASRTPPRSCQIRCAVIGPTAAASGRAADQLHREVLVAGVGQAVVEDRDDVGVAQARQGHELAAQVGGAAGPRHDLQRHRPAGRQVEGAVDHADRALAEPLDHSVALGRPHVARSSPPPRSRRKPTRPIVVGQRVA